MNTTKNLDISLVSFDIDNTLIEFESLRSNFIAAWPAIRKESNVTLCYNTGRLLDDVLNLIRRRILPTPDYIISGVGTNIYDFPQKTLLKEFSDVLVEGWDLDKIQNTLKVLDLPVKMQPSKFQHDFKRSYFLENAVEKQLEEVRTKLQETGLDVNVVYSGNQFLDILPKWANKGNALQWLLKYIGLEANKVVVAGDSGNDSAMYALDGVHGILIQNAQEELFTAINPEQTYYAGRSYSMGVLEGLHNYGVVSENLFNRFVNDATPEIDVDERIIEHLDESELEPMNQEERDFIIQGYYKAIDAIRLNITPLGFSACSLDHNTSTGTDENYRSVWTRDGAITIIGTTHLKGDHKIRDCQRNTFTTLLKHMTVNGQLPSNVSIDTETPDYSGVGGICSIDGGLWFVIAFYDYIKATRELDFLREHIDSLQKIMNWLSAQDGNNDALLEIPEAGDWTDLFGRSYNVLYDEVLWYRANVCFGRLLEMLGNHQDAGSYLRWSRVIKQKIVMTFWPSTGVKLPGSYTFAEQQYSLGDSSYLIAQVTPFDFSWRCDVYGNLLAYTYNVLDREKAQSAFRFMWGVGVNEPYPVVNVYPPVSPGDPDWRSYYTVNLLNLPKHYHNGGIWPFVGAAWVQCIHKLGLTVLARKELFKLASLNHLGINQEWEFNEWAHGETGRPMGKIYQAWSAAMYIQACHTLKMIRDE